MDVTLALRERLPFTVKLLLALTGLPNVMALPVSTVALAVSKLSK